MGKLKTRKSVVKRFKVTAKKNVLKRASGQNHFNAREDSNKKRNKRNDTKIVGKMAKNILMEI